MNLAVELGRSFIRRQPEAAARVLEQLPPVQLSAEIENCDAAELTPVLEVMAVSTVLTIFQDLRQDQQRQVLELASPRLALLILDGLDSEDREQLLGVLPPAVAADLTDLMQFPADSAGRMMDPPFETVRVQTTVSELRDLLRDSTLRRARSVYVVDNSNRLVGRVDMQALALAEVDQDVRQIMDAVQGSVLATAGREELVELLDRLRVDSIPVVDVAGRLLGVVRYQRLFDVLESVATADLQKMVGASADERAMSKASFAVKRRLPWLHINLLTAFLAASVVGLFENLIAQFTALAVLLPVVAGQSGNAGSQALAVTMRGLALREIGTRHWRSVLGKEIRVGVVDGFALAVTCGLGVFWWSQSVGLAAVIGVAMILSMIAAGIAGALVPIVLIRLGQDPATAASIILTTVTDVAGFLAFLGTASLLSFLL
ncbi:MAG: magnesium transporter [bacterium]